MEKGKATDPRIWDKWPIWHLDQCIQCGSRRTYTYGNPLPGQSAPPEGYADQRTRSRRHCNECNADWSLANGR